MIVISSSSGLFNLQWDGNGEDLKEGHSSIHIEYSLPIFNVEDPVLDFFQLEWKWRAVLSYIFC